jgi:hypothetical protein
MKKLLPLLALFAGLFTSTLWAQVAGTISGSVLDPTGAAVAGAQIELYLGGGTKPVISSKTTSDGLFTISGVRAETYQIKIAAPGFSPYVLNGVEVNPAREVSLPAIKLQVGTVNSTVEVSTQNEGVQTSSVEVTNTVTMQQVASLPVVNRSPLTLIGTQAGVLTTMNNENSTINGQRTSFSNVTLNGVNIQDNFIRANALDYLPNLLLSGQVAEFSVSTSNMDASQSAASAVTFISPTGGNSYHGSAFWSNRNNYFAANNWFNNTNGVKRPFLNQNQLGATFSGHILKDKWFFYANYEAFRLRQQSAFQTTILTADARNGIFTYKDSSGNVQKANILNLTSSSINPAIAPILSQVPTSDKINNFDSGDSSTALLRNTAGYSFLARNNETRNNVTGTTDYVISSRQSASASFSWNSDLLDRPSQQNDYSLVPKVNNDNVTKFLSGSWRFTPTAALTNELRGGFNLAPGIFATSQQFGSAIVTGFVFNNPVNTFRGQGRNTNTYNLNDNATWVHGKHYMKFGFAYQSIHTAPYNDAGITPTYTIGIGAGHTGLVTSQLPGISASDLTAANNLLASLTGAIISSSQTFNVNSQTSGFVNGATSLRHFQYDNYAFYIQDNWRVLPNLTIEAGLRYEYNVPLKETDNLELNMQIQNNDIAGTLLNPAASFDFVKGGFYNPDKKDFGPRLGFAWNVFGDNKTSVRGGFGIYYVNDEVITSVRNSLETNPGLTSTATVSGSKDFANSLTPLAVPALKIPRTNVDNYALSTTNAVGVTNPNLKTPYTSQYSLSIQHEIKGTVLSASYIGNHGTKLLRGIDYNQAIITQNGLLPDFLRAQKNGFLARTATGSFNPAYNAAIAGSQPLTFFPTLPSNGSLTNATVLSYLQTGDVGTLAQFYQTNRLNGNVNFFPNPNALALNYTSNGADSTYNSLQLDARKRYSNGLALQANYTFSKVLSNTLGDTQTNFEPFLDNANPQAERAPAPFDLRHIFKANGTYELPMGPGHSFNPKYFGRVLGGWTVGSILTWQSGSPFSILTGSATQAYRGTLNRSARSTYNTANALVGGSDLTNNAVLRFAGNGAYFFSPSSIGSDGRGVAPDGAATFAGQLFANPTAGTIGSLQRRSFYGPNEFNQDLAILKDVKLRESHTLQIRVDSTNVWNHASFFVGDQNINSTTFGKVTSTFFGRRLVQFQLTYKF